MTERSIASSHNAFAAPPRRRRTSTLWCSRMAPSDTGGIQKVVWFAVAVSAGVGAKLYRGKSRIPGGIWRGVGGNRTCRRVVVGYTEIISVYI
jgi:hypothetical protein